MQNSIYKKSGLVTDAHQALFLKEEIVWVLCFVPAKQELGDGWGQLVRACQTSLPQLGVLDVCTTFSVKSSTRVVHQFWWPHFVQVQKLCVFLSNRDKHTTLDAFVKYRLRWREMFVDSALMICKGEKKLSLGTRTGWPEKKMFRVFLLYCLYNNPPCFQCTFRSPVQ